MAKPPPKLPKLSLVKGSRPSTRDKRKSPSLRRVVFIPQENENIVLLEAETFYPLKLLKPIVVTVEEGATGYEKLD